ncbi:hypothetical protein VC74_gp47 [Mycobacterium phage Sparky]|uniref:Uncharacterized protein n=2 Tax=Caudoviricetes TaxID=2731619 RepID=A0A076G9B4_9CAUD|nr:hypothetical protein VC74_gp47 [Mycobacterium phage Sparky]AII28223.1 hypothetical protein PBI_SPARKY_79 [Mycobacterium phage Sparky]
MGWSIGYDPQTNRDIGYGVPAWCDHPDCDTKIDRGLSYVCGGAAYGGDHGCGRYFCEAHLGFAYDADGDDLVDADGECLPQMCKPCCTSHEHPDNPVQPFPPKSDHPEWINHKLTDPSWQQWRDENPDEVEELKGRLT